MSRVTTARKNRVTRWRKIQAQFKQRMAEKTSSGASPSSRSVIETLAEEWVMSIHTIEDILRKRL